MLTNDIISTTSHLLRNKMWLARKPKGKLAAPPKQRDKKSIFVFFYHGGNTRRCHAFIWTICFSYFSD